jgi:hypothetical protein
MQLLAAIDDQPRQSAPRTAAGELALRTVRVLQPGRERDAISRSAMQLLAAIDQPRRGASRGWSRVLDLPL